MVLEESKSDKNLSQLLDRLEERIESAEESNCDRFVDIGETLIDDFEEYGNDFYHGTWGDSADKIMDNGLKCDQEGARLSGETGTQSNVSLTHLPAWAFHYSRDQSPNTLDTVEEFVNRNYEAEVSGREEVSKFVDSLEHPKIIKGDKESYNAKILKKVKNRTNNFQEMPEIASDEAIKVQGAVFGIDYQSIADKINIKKPFTHNEIEAFDKDKYHDMGEITVSEVPQNDLTAYVPHEFLEIYKDKYIDSELSIKSYDSLKLKHELKMEDTYRKEGVRNFGGFWEGERLGVKNQTEAWNPTPYTIHISM